MVWDQEAGGSSPLTPTIMTSQIFFLPLEDRPKDYPPLTNFKGSFWHTGIVSNNKVYECFSQGKYKVSDLNRLKDQEFKKAVFLDNIDIDDQKLESEIKSGTDCAEYVARCTGLSKLKGKDKGELYPEDVYRLLKKEL